LHSHSLRSPAQFLIDESSKVEEEQVTEDVLAEAIQTDDTTWFVEAFEEAATEDGSSATVEAVDEIDQVVSIPEIVPDEEEPSPPTDAPTSAITQVPSGEPSNAPSGSPSGEPSNAPSGSPSGEPSNAPSGSPSGGPSNAPSESPSGGPSNAPTATPLTDADIHTAALAWCTGGSDKTTATVTYGLMEDWNVAQVTDMNYLFCGDSASSGSSGSIASSGSSGGGFVAVDLNCDALFDGCDIDLSSLMAISLASRRPSCWSISFSFCDSLSSNTRSVSSIVSRRSPSSSILVLTLIKSS
jgi:hypothetical protein